MSKVKKYKNIALCNLSHAELASEFNFKNVNSFRCSSKFGVYMNGIDRLLSVGISVGKEMAKRDIVEQLNKK